MTTASRKVVSGRSHASPIRSTAKPMPDPMPRHTRPCANSSSAPTSMAIRVGWRLYGLNTPAPMWSRRVARAQAAAAGRMPRLNGFSANQTPSNPTASAACACATHCCGVSPPCRRRLRRGNFGKEGCSNAARARAGFAGREMRVNDAPLPVLLAKHHGRARNELAVVVFEVARRRLLAGPLAPRLAVTPHDREVAGDGAADVVGRPIGGADVLLIELPQLRPVFAADVGVTVEIEVGRLRRRAEQRLEILPIKPGVHVEIGFVQPQDFLAVLLAAADKGVIHS